MGTVFDAAPAMQADKDISSTILVNRINGTGLHTFTAADTELFPDNNPAALALTEGTCRTGGNTRSGVASQTQHGDKAGRKAAGGMDADAGS